MMEKKRAAGYIRCSTDMQDQSLEGQRNAIEAYAEQHDLEVVQWFEDEGKSGTTTEKRPGFCEMIRVVENGQKDFQLILVYDVSRWGRYGDANEPAYWEFHCKRHGVGVAFTNESFLNDNSPGSAIMKQVSRTSAGEYSKRLAIDTIRGCRMNAARGFFNGGTPPYGYRRILTEADGTPLRQLGSGEQKLNGQKIKLMLGPEEEVKTVRRIFRLSTVHGYSEKSIVNKLNEERLNGGVSSPRGGAWTVSTVRGMLRNAAYCGRIVWGRHCTHHLIYPDSIGKHHDKSEWVVCDGAHPAIVSVKMWEKNQQGARHYANFRKPKSSSPYLLSGLIRCMHCGHNFQGQQKTLNRKKPNTYRYYVCGGYQRMGRTECVSFSIPKQEIETKIIKAVRRRLKRSGALERIARDLEHQLAIGAQEPTERIAELEAEFDRIQVAEQRILKAVEEGMPYAASWKRMEGLQSRRDEINQEIAEWQEQEGAGGNPVDTHAQIMAFLEDFERILSQGDLEEQRIFLRCFVDRIEVDPETEDIQVFMYKVPASDPKALEDIATTTE